MIDVTKERIIKGLERCIANTADSEHFRLSCVIKVHKKRENNRGVTYSFSITKGEIWMN